MYDTNDDTAVAGITISVEEFEKLKSHIKELEEENSELKKRLGNLENYWNDYDECDWKARELIYKKYKKENK